MSDVIVDRSGAEPDRPLERRLRILDPERHRTSARPMRGRILLGIASGLGIDDEVDLPLAVEGDVLALVPRDRGKAHLREQLAQQRRVGRGIFDELEPVGPHRIVEPEDALLPGKLGGHFRDAPSLRCTCPLKPRISSERRRGGSAPK
jgi:hypothetical protein